jgi:hypothetical protein
MTPAAIIRQCTVDGVELALSPTGTIKATGDGATVNHWLPLIREHKPSILAALREAANKTWMTAEDVRAIHTWLLAYVKETDPMEIQSVLDECRADPGALSYFLGRAAEVAL